MVPNQATFDREWWDKMCDKFTSWFGSHKEMNRNRPGRYGGIGPKNYQRNGQRIYEDVCELLTENDGIDARDIEVRIDGNYVVLSGTVRTWSEKRRAEYLVADVPGVWDVENRLRVGRN